MTWNVTFLAVHLLALAGFISLYREAPCWMQKVSVVGFAIGMGLCSAAYGLAVAGVWWYADVRSLGDEIVHLALLLYVFRLIYQEHLQWKPSSLPSRSL